MKPTKRLFLIDGMSSIYRAYWAIPRLSNSKGLPTNAVLGFAMMLRKLITDYKPDYLGIAMDVSERTFRHDAYDQYKKDRQAMPDDLSTQIEYILKVCDVLRVPILKLPRWEADDVIGTLAKKASSLGLQTVIVSSDKDLCQLVQDPQTIILKVDKTGETWFDEAAVKKRIGVRPDQVVDLLGLMGDSIDGIPGAPGIGEKGAVQLIEQFETLDRALAGWEEVKRKNHRESLRDFVEQIKLSRELAKLDLDAPIELDLDNLIAREPDRKAAYDLFSELEFAQFSREFADAAGKVEPSEPRPSDIVEYSRHESLGDVRRLSDALHTCDRFAFSIAGMGSALEGVGFSSAPGRADYVDLSVIEGKSDALKLVGGLLDNGIIEKSVYDLKRAVATCAGLNIELNGVSDDVLIAAYLLDPERGKYELSDLAREYGGISIESRDETWHRTAMRADLTGRLADLLSARIESDGLNEVYREIELPLAPLIHRIERAGFRVDTKVLEGLSNEMERELENLTSRIYGLAGEEFNINSPSQLGDIFERLNFEVSRRTTTGKISTSRDILDELAAKYELPRLIIEFREMSKLKGTYVDAFPGLIDPRDGRIHTTLNQTSTATGRLSSTEPNLQNIPIRTEMGRRIRRAFVPEKGNVLLSADYSQIELRLLAHVTQDPVMLEAFSQGEDIHARTARDVFGAKTGSELKEKRRVAKIVNFGIAYSIGAFGLSQRISISRSEARKVIDDYYRTFAGVKRYMVEFPEKVRSEGCVVRSIFGRLRRLPDLKNKNASLRARAERETINMPMQGSASDIVKRAMLRADAALEKAKIDARMILQVHDELVFEVPESQVEKATKVIKQAMENAAELAVPLARRYRRRKELDGCKAVRAGAIMIRHH